MAYQGLANYRQPQLPCTNQKAPRPIPRNHFGMVYSGGIEKTRKGFGQEAEDGSAKKVRSNEGLRNHRRIGKDFVVGSLRVGGFHETVQDAFQVFGISGWRLAWVDVFLGRQRRELVVDVVAAEFRPHLAEWQTVLIFAQCTKKHESSSLMRNLSGKLG